MAPRTQGSGIELRGLRAAAEGAAVEARCQGHFVGIDDAVAVLVIPAAHCGGVLLAGDAVIADSHAICNGRQGADPQRRGTVSRGPRTMPESAGLRGFRVRTMAHGHKTGRASCRESE